MSPRIKSTLLYVLGTTLGASLLYLALSKADFAELWQMLGQAAWAPLVGGLAVMLFSHWCRARRWSLLLRAATYPVPTKRTFAAVMFGYLVNYAVPRLGEVSRCTVLIKSNRTPLATSAGTVVTERVIDVIMLALSLGIIFLIEVDTLTRFFSASSNPLEAIKPIHILAAGGGFLLLVVAFFMLRKRLLATSLGQKIMTFLRKLIDGLLSIRHLDNPLYFILLSLGVWGGYVFSTWLFLLAFPTTAGAGLWLAFILNAMGAIGMALPVPGGLGPFHAAITYTMVLYGFTESQGANIALVMHTSQLIVNILVGAASYGWLLFQQPSEAELAREAAVA